MHLAQMGSGPSSSKDQMVETSKTKRKFESYHLPFANRKQKKGFAKLKSNLFGSNKKKKKPNNGSNSYDSRYALTFLRPNSGVTTGPSVPIVYDRSSSDDVRNLDYQLYYRTFGGDSNPIHLSLCDGFADSQHFVDVDLDNEDRRRTRSVDDVSLPDEQFLSADSVIHDAYSEVIKRAIETKLNLSRDECSSCDKCTLSASEPKRVGSAEVVAFDDSERVIAQEAASERVTAKEAASERVIVKEAVSKRVIAQEAASEQVTAKEAASQQVTAKEAASERVIAQEAVSKRVIAQEAASERVTAKEAASERVIAKEADSECVVQPLELSQPLVSVTCSSKSEVSTLERLKLDAVPSELAQKQNFECSKAAQSLIEVFENQKLCANGSKDDLEVLKSDSVLPDLQVTRNLEFPAGSTDDSRDLQQPTDSLRCQGSPKQRVKTSDDDVVAVKVSSGSLNEPTSEVPGLVEPRADLLKPLECLKPQTSSSRPLMISTDEIKLSVEQTLDNKSHIEQTPVLNSDPVVVEVATARNGQEINTAINLDLSSTFQFQDEGNALLQEIAEKEQNLSEKLSKVQSLWLNSGVRRVSDTSDSSGERSGSVGDEDMAVCGSQSSDAVESGMSSVDSPWEEIDEVADVGGTTTADNAEIVESKNVAKEDVVNLSFDEGADKAENVVSAILEVPCANKVESRSWIESSGFLTDVGMTRLAARQSSPASSSSSSRNEKGSGSSSSGYSYFGEDRRLPRNADAIISKLVTDLMTNLEVDLGDFQELLMVDAALEEKYKLLDVDTLLRHNLKIGIGEDDLSRCLRVLAKYGLNLLKPESERPKYWKKVVTMPRGGGRDSSVHWLSIKGFKQVLLYFGYCEAGENFVYDNSAQVEDGFVACYIVELLLAAYELNACSVGSHPRPQIFKVEIDREQVSNRERSSEDPIYVNTLSTSVRQQRSEAKSAEISEMFGRRTIVPWLQSDKENHVVKDVVQCGLCGSSSPAVRCEKCSNLTFCLSCDDMYHRHPKRRDHVRKVANSAAGPPPPPPRPPPKLTDPNKIPVPPPRRRKSQRSTPSSPVFGRKPMEQKPELPKKQFPLKFGSLKKFMPTSLGRQPQPAPMEPASRSVAGPWPSDSYRNSPPCGNKQMPTGCSYGDSSRTPEAHFGQRKNCFRSEGQQSSVFQPQRHGQIEGFPSYYDRMSNTADPSSSDADEEISGLGSGSLGGSASRDRDDDWSRSMPSLPPPYGGMTSRLTNAHEHRQMYPAPNIGFSTLNRRNTMMSGFMERTSPFGYGKPTQYMQHSNSVCDLSNPLMHPPGIVGYPFPQVQSMADLHRGEMEGLGPMTAPCGCRNSWVGPDSFGMWHPPVRCMVHSSAASLYPGGDSTLKHVAGHQFVANPAYPSSEGVFQVHPRMFPVMAGQTPLVSPPPASPQLPPRPPLAASPPQLPISPTSSARSAENRRKSKINNTADTAREGGVRNVRSRSQRTKGNIGTSSEEDDYFSAGESDEEPGGGGRSAGRTRSARVTVPDGSWACEHCTFVNAAGTRICDVCCKTQSGKTRSSDKRRNKSVSDAVDAQPESTVKNGRLMKGSKDEGIYEDLSDVRAANADAEDTKVLPEMPESGLSVQHRAEQMSPVSSSKEVQVVEQQTDTNDISHVPLERPRDFVERSIIPEVNEAKTMSVQITATSKDTKPNEKSVTSTGTSPPPQSISTQTPNEPIWMVEEQQAQQQPTTTPTLQRASSRLSLSGDASELRSPFAPQSSLLKRATSLHFAGSSVDPSWGSNAGFMYRTGSRTSVMSDHPFGFSSGPPSRDVSPPRNFLSRRDSERAYPGYSRFGHKEDHGFLSRSGSRKDYYLSLEELVERRRHETMRTQGLELVRLLREAEQHNFTADDLQVAMNHCGSQNPIQWLHDNWRNMVDTVVTLATNYGHDKKENDVGIVSNTEAKEALRIHKGNIWAAVTECVEQRQRKFIELQNQGNYSREEVIAALTSNQGCVEGAINDLNKATLKPLLMRIWGPPAGADNEAGSETWPRFQPRRNSDMDSIDVDKSPARELYEEYSRDRGSDDQLFLSSEHLAEDLDLRSEMFESKDGEVGSDEHSDENEEEEEEWNRRTTTAKDEVFYDAVPGSPVDEDRLTVPRHATEVKCAGTLSNSMTIQVNQVAAETTTAAAPPLRKQTELDARTPTPTMLQTEIAAFTETMDTTDSVTVREEEEEDLCQTDDLSERNESFAPQSKHRSNSVAVKVQKKRAEVKSALNTEYERRVRQLLAEGKMKVYEKAEVAVKLLDLKFDESEAIYAANECSDLYMAVSYLQQNCELCAGRFPMGKMISMLFCVHRCCRNCARDYFTIKIKERNIMEAVCPFCDEPDLTDDSIATDYFNNLDIMLKNLVDCEVHELFQCKLRDRALMSDPNFHWCATCASGFIAERNHRRLVCPDCQAVTCALCKKPWEWQHDGISCERFAQWKEANDPEYQSVRLEKYLAENGIDCPKCKFKYALAKGGCMHFTCSQCKYEFCSGCGKPFLMSKKCNVSAHCEKLGLHAHHPRNCLFYLRDKEPNELQELLDDNGIDYDTVPTYSHAEGHDSRKCPVMEQKELPDGNKDAICGREIEEWHAGLCRNHYVEYLGGLIFRHKLETARLLSEDDLETMIRGSGRRLPSRSYPLCSDKELHYIEYLVSLVNKNGVDPLSIMDVTGLQQELRRSDETVPEQRQRESDDAYRERLVQLIQNEIPLAEDA